MAKMLAEELEREGAEQVAKVDEGSLNLRPQDAWVGGQVEKSAHGQFRSSVARLTGRSRHVIVDAPNHTRGGRYEFWCLAREAGTRFALVRSVISLEESLQRNSSRPSSEGYSEGALRDLYGRVEPPDGRNRWERPLFEFSLPGLSGRDDDYGHPSSGSLEEAARRAAMCLLGREHWQAHDELKPSVGTMKHPREADQSGSISRVDRAAQGIVEQVLASDAGEEVSIEVGGGKRVSVPGGIGMAELRKAKRSFLKLFRRPTSHSLPGEDDIREMFAEFLAKFSPSPSRL